MTTDEAEFDVVVVGSGAAGMTAALAAAYHGLRTVVLEKTDYFGGSTARSGGGIWAPGNEVLRKAGVRDTPDQASAYLAHVAGPVSEARRRALLARGPEMLAFVRAHTPVDFAWVPGYADYYPEAPGEQRPPPGFGDGPGDMGQVSAGPLGGVPDPGLPQYLVARRPDAAAGPRGRPAEVIRLLQDHRPQAVMRGGEGGGHPGGAAAHHDHVELGLVRRHGTSRAPC